MNASLLNARDYRRDWMPRGIRRKAMHRCLPGDEFGLKWRAQYPATIVRGWHILVTGRCERSKTRVNDRPSYPSPWIRRVQHRRGFIMFVRGADKRASGIQPNHPCRPKLPASSTFMTRALWAGSALTLSRRSSSRRFLSFLSPAGLFFLVSTSRRGRRSARSGIALHIRRRRWRII